MMMEDARRQVAMGDMVHDMVSTYFIKIHLAKNQGLSWF